MMVGARSCVLAALIAAVVGAAAAQTADDRAKGNPLVGSHVAVPNGVVLAEGYALPAREERTKLEGAPDYRPYADGVLVRPVFRTTTTDGTYRIEVWSVLVRAEGETPAVEFPGAAVLTVRSGTAILLGDDNKAEMTIGDSFALDAGKSARFLTSGDRRPVSFDVVIVQGN
jgi:hypothetical protein